MAVKAIINVVRIYSDYDGSLMIDCRITASTGYLEDTTFGPFLTSSLTINADIKAAAMQYTIDKWAFSYTPLVDTVGLSQIINPNLANV